MILKGSLIKVHDVVHGASCGGKHALGRYQMWTSWKHETSFKNICGCDVGGTFNKLHLIRRRMNLQIEVLFMITSLMKMLYKKKIKELKTQLQKVLKKRYIILNKLAYGIIIFLFIKRMESWKCMWTTKLSTRWNLKYALFTLCIWFVWSTFGCLSIHHDWFAFRLLLNLNCWKGWGENCLLHKVGFCEFIMIFFRLTNAPTMLCTLVNDLFKDYLMILWSFI
jgi:hypothetical protein